MFIIGLDLSGPSNTRDTACTVFKKTADRLIYHQSHIGMTDPDIFQLVYKLASKSAVAIGIDAPLSYNPGGGDRPGDRLLRKLLVTKGAHSGSVMTPTMTRMAYLTLRGVSLTRMLDGMAQVVEVHPGATMILRDAPIEAVRTFKSDMVARLTLLGWLEDQGLHGLQPAKDPTDHYIAASAAALATWDWSKNESTWLHLAEPPYHPYDFAC
jgi:predicted nuclease with RNAse H fold